MVYIKNSFLVNRMTAAVVCLACLLLLAGCRKKPQPAPPPPKITVARPLKRKVTYYLELTGNTQAVNSVQLVARVPGYLDKVYFHDGQMVKKGQSLFLIQQNTYLANLQQAEGNVLAQRAQLVYAENQLDRYSHLYPEKAASQTDVDNWRYQRDSAQANLKEAIAKRDLAKLDLSYTRVTAPFSGRIDRRLQDPGNLVGSSSSNTNLAQMDQIDPIYLYFTVSDTDLARLVKSRHGIPGVSMRLPFFAGLVGEEGYPHQGYIDFASISVSDNTGTLPMRGVLANPAGIVLPGLYARVQVPLETRDVLLVPGTAIGNDQQGDYLLIVDEKNTVGRRNVKTGPVEGDLRVVQEGLIGNERVVVRALLKAYPGSRVTPVWENEPMRGNR
ncbi:MAG: efflux RND transporter periplasmic adaptor subunit [Nitrospirota bacterium]